MLAKGPATTIVVTLVTLPRGSGMEGPFPPPFETYDGPLGSSFRHTNCGPFSPYFARINVRSWTFNSSTSSLTPSSPTRHSPLFSPPRKAFTTFGRPLTMGVSHPSPVFFLIRMAHPPIRLRDFSYPSPVEVNFPPYTLTYGDSPSHTLSKSHLNPFHP